MVGFTCFSTEEDDNDDDNHNNDGDDDTEDEEDEEVNFPNQGYVQQKRQTVQGRKQPRTPIAAKNLNLIRAPKCGKSGYAEIAAWNGQLTKELGTRSKEDGWQKLNNNKMQEEGSYAKHAPVLVPYEGFGSTRSPHAS